MSFSLPNGTGYDLATAYAAAVNVTAATNATECVLTTAANTYAAGDFLEFTSGWSKATNRIFRVKAATSTSATLEGFDTTDTSLFPAGLGTGSVRKISTWQTINQVVGSDMSGGDTKYTTVAPLDTDAEINLPDGISAMNLTLTIGDDPTLPQHAALKAASISRKMAALRARLPAGGVILYDAYVSYNETPTMTKGQVMAVKAGFAVQNTPVRYAS